MRNIRENLEVSFTIKESTILLVSSLNHSTVDIINLLLTLYSGYHFEPNSSYIYIRRNILLLDKTQERTDKDSVFSVWTQRPSQLLFVIELRVL